MFQLSASFLVTEEEVCHVHMMCVNMINCWHDAGTLFFLRSPRLFSSRIHIGSLRLWPILPVLCALAMITRSKIRPDNLDAPYSMPR